MERQDFVDCAKVADAGEDARQAEVVELKEGYKALSRRNRRLLVRMQEEI